MPEDCINLYVHASIYMIFPWELMPWDFQDMMLNILTQTFMLNACTKHKNVIDWHLPRGLHVVVYKVLNASPRPAIYHHGMNSVFKAQSLCM